MFDVIRDYKSYLETNCRLPQEAVVNHLGNLPIIFDNLNITSLTDIDAGKVSSAWKVSRWESTSEGIQISEPAQSGYLLALKEFLLFLEEKGHLTGKTISEIINLPENNRKKLRGLNQQERAKLREYLLFNVKNDTQRRETALMFILLSTGCSLSEALALTVSGEGVIYTEKERQPSGNFEVAEDRLYVTIRGVDGTDRKVRLSAEVGAFMNFYLENRKQVSRILFLSSGRSNKPKAMTEASAQKIVERVFEKAGIPMRKGEALNVLRCTALEDGLIKENNRQIISLHQPAKDVKQTALTNRQNSDRNWRQAERKVA